MSDQPSALTTGQAAKLCFVTADTVANWIRSGLLRAQRTAGGQYRILTRDLHAFMLERGMSTEGLQPAGDGRPPCFEVRRRPYCAECIVRYLKVFDCFKLMAMRPPGSGPVPACTECEYFRRYGESPPEETPGASDE
jgi:excisionase family DNA binding protein